MFKHVALQIVMIFLKVVNYIKLLNYRKEE